MLGGERTERLGGEINYLGIEKRFEWRKKRFGGR